MEKEKVISEQEIFFKDEQEYLAWLDEIIKKAEAAAINRDLNGGILSEVVDVTQTPDAKKTFVGFGFKYEKNGSGVVYKKVELPNGQIARIDLDDETGVVGPGANGL